MNISGYRFICVDDNEDLLNKSYQLRYKIYCKEVKYLDPENYSQEKEIDQYDAHSIHFAAVDKDDNVLGTIRLVLDSELGFPLEKYCPEYDNSKICFPRSQLAEISRLTVDKSFRRRKHDGMYGMASYDEKAMDEIPEHIREKRKRPVIVIGLYKMVYMESKKRGMTHWYAAMEEKLSSALAKFSFKFDPIGPVQNYSGPVIPFLGEISEIEDLVYRNKPELLHLMIYGLYPRYMPNLCFMLFLRNYFFINFAKLTGRI